MSSRGGEPVNDSIFQIGARFLNSVTALTKVEEDDFSRKASLSYAEVKHLQEQLAVASVRLRYIENATRPINRLPSAVLLKIFHVLQDTPFSPSLLEPYSLHWNVVTFVCSQWRKFALSAPTLWTRVPVRSKGGFALVDTFLARSSSLPLTIILAQDPLCNSFSITRVQIYLRGLRHIINNAADRIERLVMEPRFPIDDLIRADRLGKTLGQELLSRVLLLPSGGPPDAVSNTMENSLSKLFSESMPQVQHLELWSEAVPYLLRRPDPLRHLTVLELCRVKNEPSANIDLLVFSKVLDVLNASRGSLRRLVLAGVELQDDLHSQLANGDSPSPPPIALSSLESIEIGDWESQETLSRFLQQLQVPPSASKCIWGTTLSPTAIGPFILPSLKLDFSASNIHVVDRIVLSSTAQTNMIAFHKGSLYINGNLSFEDYSPLLNDLSTSQFVRELVLTPLLAPPTIEDWTRLFRLLPQIRKIKVRDAEASRLLRALRKGADGDDVDETNHQLLLPNLTDFDIKYSIPRRPWKELLENESTTEVWSMVMLLTLLARERAQGAVRFGPGKLIRIHLRIDSRVIDLHDIAALVGQLREWVSWLDCSSGDDSYSLKAEEQVERRKEQQDDWYLVMKEFNGIWPTNAVYFLRSPSNEDPESSNFGLRAFAAGHLA